MQSPLASTSVVPPSWKLVWMPWETSLAAWIGKPISALSEGTDSAGGYTVPTVLSAQLIDMLRADSVVMAAGAQSVPMARDNLSFAKVASDPVPAFRAEAAAIAESDPTFSTGNNDAEVFGCNGEGQPRTAG